MWNKINSDSFTNLLFCLISGMSAAITKVNIIFHSKMYCFSSDDCNNNQIGKWYFFACSPHNRSIFFFGFTLLPLPFSHFSHLNGHKPKHLNIYYTGVPYFACWLALVKWMHTLSFLSSRSTTIRITLHCQEFENGIESDRPTEPTNGIRSHYFESNHMWVYYMDDCKSLTNERRSQPNGMERMIAFYIRSQLHSNDASDNSSDRSELICNNGNRIRKFIIIIFNLIRFVRFLFCIAWPMVFVFFIISLWLLEKLE